MAGQGTGKAGATEFSGGGSSRFEIRKKSGMANTIGVEDKGGYKGLGNMKDRISPKRMAMPKDLLPTLHLKTHFKAAVEYSLGPGLTHRSLHDKGGQIERTIFEEYQKNMEAKQ